MARPKGSKNKPKEEVAPAPVVEVEKPKEAWKPSPDMGAIKPPSPSIDKCKTCGHERRFHYEGKADWCNLSVCQCQAWK